MSLDLTKPVQTRNGREVRIYATDGDGNRPIHGAIKNAERWSLAIWRASGSWMSYSGLNPLDLVNVPVKRRAVTLWVNVYGSGANTSHDSRKRAHEYAERFALNRIACLEFTREYTEGEGL